MQLSKTCFFVILNFSKGIFPPYLHAFNLHSSVILQWFFILFLFWVKHHFPKNAILLCGIQA